MKAITLTQPWATLVAIGAKKIETRSWACYYSGPLAIHAAKGYNKGEYAASMSQPEFQDVLSGLDPLADCGKVISVTNVMRCMAIGANGYPAAPSHSEFIKYFTDRERAFGNFEPGRFAWLIGPVRRIAPVAAVGHQMLWEWEPPQ